jgi:alpha-beta hydrolase superfamily lysophospholipase
LFWLLLLLILLVASDLVVQCVYVRLVLRIFETKPPFAVPSFPPDPAAEQISFVTADGVTLRGSIHRPVLRSVKGLILFCPELEGSHWSAATYAHGLLESGFAVLSFDFRSQGESDSQPGYAPLHWTTTFEVEDTRAALRFIKRRVDLCDLPLGVMGVSRGSTPALIAAAESEHVKAVCCEGAYSTDTLLVHFISRWATIYVPRFLLPILPMWHIRVTSFLVRWTSRLLRGRRYVVLEQWLPRLKDRAVLLVAGARDNYVHPDVGRALLKRISSPDVQFWLVPTAKHNRARQVGPAEYDRRLRDFFDQTLASQPV